MAIEFVIEKLEVESLFSGLLRVKLANKEMAKELYKKDFSGFKAKLTKPKEKSKNANSYMWKLCDEIATKMSEPKEERWTKEDIYREAIQSTGVWEDVAIKDCTQEMIDRFTKEFVGDHIGSFVQEIRSTREWTYLRCYYGSQHYTQEELSRVIDYVVRKALDEGIDPDTPQERERLLRLWEG